eukprot:Platyproteum_vivax@DN10974_c0_g1_i1.p1
MNASSGKKGASGLEHAFQKVGKVEVLYRVIFLKISDRPEKMFSQSGLTYDYQRDLEFAHANLEEASCSCESVRKLLQPVLEMSESIVYSYPKFVNKSVIDLSTELRRVKKLLIELIACKNSLTEGSTSFKNDMEALTHTAEAVLHDVKTLRAQNAEVQQMLRQGYNDTNPAASPRKINGY